MSHVVSIKTELTDLDAVKAVCQELGLIFREGQKEYAWWGETFGDYPLPEGFTAAQLGKCEHAISVPGTNWEIGLAKPSNVAAFHGKESSRFVPGTNRQVGLAKPATGEGYRLLFDFYGHRGKPILDAVGGKEASKFVQLYGVHKAMIECKKRGHIVRREVGRNGAINLVVTGM